MKPAGRGQSVRVIGHMDLDYFYAQVEEVADPSLKGRPVLVCVFSGRTADSGVVSTANYVARRLGAKSGIPIALAKKKLEGSDPVIIRMDHAKYEAVSDRVMRLVDDRADAVEQTGIDEAFFDVTVSCRKDFAKARELAADLKAAVLRSEGLTCSVGIGRSKAVAKLASDFVKPDGLTVVAPDSTEGFLGPLPVTKLYGVGPKTERELAELGITTIHDLAVQELPALERRLGRSMATYLHLASRGEDDEPVTPGREATQMSRMITLKEDTSDPREAFSQLLPAMEDLEKRLASERVAFRTISVIGILTDLSIRTKSKTLESPQGGAGALHELVPALLGQLSESTGKKFRRVGVRLSDLSKNDDQVSLTQFLQ